MKSFFNKNSNLTSVIREIINHGFISRSDIAKNTSINKATISEICTTLIDKNIIYEAHEGSASNQGGRKPIMLAFNFEIGTSISINVSATSIRGILCWLNGVIIEEIEIPHINIEKDIYQLIKQLVKLNPDTPLGIIGATLGIHGQVINNEVIFSPIYDIERNIINNLQSKVNFPIYGENEANLSAIAEYTFAPNTDNLVNINIDAGIGAGVIENGVLNNGKTGLVGEIGHNIIVPNGKKCPCGNNGCLEQYSSLKAILNSLKEIDNSISTVAQIKSSYFTNKSIKNIIDQSTFYLSIVINNIMTLHECDEIIINAELFTIFPELINNVTCHFNNFLTRNLHVTISSLGKDSVLQGGNVYNMQKLLGIDGLKF